MAKKKRKGMRSRTGKTKMMKMKMKGKRSKDGNPNSKKMDKNNFKLRKK